MATQPTKSDASANIGVQSGENLCAPEANSALETRSERATPEGDGAAAPTASYVPAGDNASVPLSFGPYTIIDEIAHGGMGVIYRARHTLLGRVVALKVIRSGLGANPDLSERFLREARLVAGLKHRNIVNILDFGDVNGHLYFTMALAASGSLAQHLSRFRVDQRAAVTLLEKVSRAVQCIHDHGLLHRDLKPANILLEEGDEPLVSDFGLARAVEPTEDMTQPGVVLGTIAYMSPEQAMGDPRQVGPATDVWALGVILFELLCGRRPFVGEDRVSILEAIRTADPPSPRSVSPGLPRPLETILLKCLEKEPARRYPSAGALADDLGCWLRGEPIKAQPLTRIGKARRWAGRHPRLVSSAAALFLIALVLAYTLPRLAPDRVWTHDLRPRMENNEPVTLVGENGPPRWFQWELPGTLGPSRPEDPLSINTGSLSLMVLAPDPQRERYRFRAEVLHERASRSGSGEVGLFLGYTKHQVPAGEVHCFLALRFADWGGKVVTKVVNEKKVPFGKVHLKPVHYCEPVSGKSFNRTVPIKFEREFIAFSKDDRADWRLVSIEVTPERIAVFWGAEREPVGELTREERHEKSRNLLFKRPDMAGAQPDFPPRGALGLLVYQSAASFRNVVVEPLDD